MEKSNFVLLLTGTSVLLILVAFTGRADALGAIIGYWIGFVYTQWLHKDALRSAEDDITTALSRMRRSLFTRLGMITLVVALVGRFSTDWLIPLAMGIALGLIVSLFVSIRKIAHSGKG